MLILAIGVIATAPLFVYAAQENAVGGDLGAVGALAVRRMETLRGTPYVQLNNGGTLDSNTTGFFDDSTPGYVIRWSIADNPNPPAPTKVVTVRAVALRQVIGKEKSVTMFGIRGG